MKCKSGGSNNQAQTTMANTCQYYIKKTNDPRICGKKSYIIFGEDDDEADTGFSSLLFPVGFECSGPSLWLCRKHFKMLENQTKKLKARTSGISEKVIASSLLHFHLKFQQKISTNIQVLTFHAHIYIIIIDHYITNSTF